MFFCLCRINNNDNCLQVRANPLIRFAEWNGDINLYCTAYITTCVLCVLFYASSLLEDECVITCALVEIQKNIAEYTAYNNEYLVLNWQTITLHIAGWPGRPHREVMLQLTDSEYMAASCIGLCRESWRIDTHWDGKFHSIQINSIQSLLMSMLVKKKENKDQIKYNYLKGLGTFCRTKNSMSTDLH